MGLSRALRFEAIEERVLLAHAAPLKNPERQRGQVQLIAAMVRLGDRDPQVLQEWQNIRSEAHSS